MHEMGEGGEETKGNEQDQKQGPTPEKTSLFAVPAGRRGSCSCRHKGFLSLRWGILTTIIA